MSKRKNENLDNSSSKVGTIHLEETGITLRDLEGRDILTVDFEAATIMHTPKYTGGTDVNSKK